MLTAEQLALLVSRFRGARIAVIGDYFLDKYLDVDPARVERSLETGLLAHQAVSVRTAPGAAGSVMVKLAALGAGRLYAIGFRGDDGHGYELARDLDRLGCDISHLHVRADLYTPTYTKPRDIGALGLAAEHPRYDIKNHRPTPPDLRQQIIESVDRLLPDLDAIVVIDQVTEADCGVLAADVREALVARAAANPHTIFWCDSRRHIRLYRNMILKPNQFELLRALPGTPVDLQALIAAGQELRCSNGAPVAITLGPAGALVSDPQWTFAPTVRIEGETDPTGAGDSFSAGAVMALCAGATLPQAAVTGNLVASVTVQQLGTTGTASPDQLVPRLQILHSQIPQT